MAVQIETELLTDSLSLKVSSFLTFVERHPLIHYKQSQMFQTETEK
jgi:hypothetical protein